jgi:hypothetical protein
LGAALDVSFAMEAEHPKLTSRRPIGLWIGFLGPPAAWLGNLQITYSVVPWTCAHGHHWMIHVVTLLFLMLTIVCGAIAWYERAYAGEWSGDKVGGMVGTRRLLGAVGVAGAFLFATIILAQGIAAFFLGPCHD